MSKDFKEKVKDVGNKIDDIEDRVDKDLEYFEVKNTGKVKRWIFATPLIIVLILIIVLGIFVYKSCNPTPFTITSSEIAKTIRESNLNVAKFVHNGFISYAEGKYVKYKAKVTAWVDFSEVDVSLNEEQKIVTVLLPEIQYDANMDEKGELTFLPKDAKGDDIGPIYEKCKEDALEASRNSEEFNNVTKENLTNTITALVLPLVEEEYSIVCEFKGGQNE